MNRAKQQEKPLRISNLSDCLKILQVEWSRFAERFRPSLSASRSS
jgi:hypothetical protein